MQCKLEVQSLRRAHRMGASVASSSISADSLPSGLDLAFEPIVYVNQEAYAQSFGKGEWDIAIGVRSPLAQEKSTLGPDFMVADAMYIAAPGKEFADASQIDRPGVKVGVSRGGGSDQILSRALKAALVVRVEGGVPNATEALRSGVVDVWAANPVTLQAIEAATARFESCSWCVHNRAICRITSERTIRRSTERTRRDCE